MPPDHDAQLLKGVLSLLLLHVLAERESYGYEVVHRLHEIGLTDIAAGTVYPALSRLERERSGIPGPHSGHGPVDRLGRPGLAAVVSSRPASLERPMTCPST